MKRRDFVAAVPGLALLPALLPLEPEDHPSTEALRPLMYPRPSAFPRIEIRPDQVDESTGSITVRVHDPAEVVTEVEVWTNAPDPWRVDGPASAAASGGGMVWVVEARGPLNPRGNTGIMWRVSFDGDTLEGHATIDHDPTDDHYLPDLPPYVSLDEIAGLSGSHGTPIGEGG